MNVITRLFYIAVLLLFILEPSFSQTVTNGGDKVKLTNQRLLNTPALEFAPTYFRGDLLFVSDNPVKGKTKVFDKKIKSNGMSLFISKKDRNGYYRKPEPVDTSIVSNVHDGPASFDAQNEVLYLTRNDNKDNGQKARYVDKVNYMKLYMISLVEDSWGQPQPLPFNEEKSDACHPSVSADGQKLFFSSNRAGGLGGFDLYMTVLTDGTWSAPVNLGEAVNSPNDDVFPFIHADGTLYFSSTRPKGQGGLDIYYTRIDTSGHYIAPKALGKPFNTDRDDFGFIVDADNKTGFMSSNRSGGLGGDDIYSFTIPDKLPPFSDVKTLSDNKANQSPEDAKTYTVFVIERKSGLPLSNAYICTASTNTQPPSVETAGNNCETIVTDENGKATLHVNLNNNYFVRVTKTDFKPNSFTILKNDGRNQSIILMDRLGEKSDEPVVVDRKRETTVSRIYQLRNIYYDYDDASIRPEAKIVLDSLVEVLYQFPEMEIELAAHTDSRGNVPYNLNLSKRRANSVIEYLVSKGIKRKRLNAVGYGKFQLANDCGDGKPCPPEKHQENRRTEIRILRSGGSDGKIIQDKTPKRY